MAGAALPGVRAVTGMATRRPTAKTTAEATPDTPPAAEAAPAFDFQAWIDQARPAERTVSVCLAGDLVAEIEALERRAAELAAGPDTSSKEGDPRTDTVEQIRALQERMRAATRDVRLRRLPARAYRELRAKHPPRRDGDTPDQGDVNVSFNRETFFTALIPACAVDPVLTPQQWEVLLDEDDGPLSYGQIMELADAAYKVNEFEVSVPFSPAALLTNPDTGGA